MNSPRYSIVIPAYNEAQRVMTTLERVLAYADAQQWSLEVIVVDDGSRDNSADVISKFAERDSRVRLVRNPGNRGKGYSVRNGMMHAQGQVMLFTDADLSSPIEEASKLLTALAQGADVAIGSRWLRSELQTERQPLYRQLFSRLFNFALRLVLGLKFKDTQCGFKAFTAPAANLLFSRQKIERWGFDPELLFLSNKLGLEVHEVPVAWAHDDRSKMSYFRDGLHMGWEMLKIRWYDLSGEYAPLPQCAAKRV
jgi:glycosyltransferase involved in cell wall biosynthesis